MALALQTFGPRIIATVGNNLLYQSNHSFIERKLNFTDITIQSKNTSRLSESTNHPSHGSQKGVTTPKANKGHKGVSTTTNRTSPSNCQHWCHRKENSSKSFFLTAVLLVRIYVKDLAELSTREMRQWLYYLRYAGFQHVYVYDAYVTKSESQAHALKPLIDEGFVTYVDWSHRAYPYSIDGTQHSAYQDCINRFGHETLWQAAIDIDEYPFSPTDQKPLFAQRAVARYSKQAPDASELTMQNYLFLGKPLNASKHPLLIDRIWRRTHGPANPLVKPIYRPSHVSRATVHHNALSRGSSRNFPADHLRLNHYWGARLQNWGEDTPEIIAKTQPDNLMKPIITTLQNCVSECLPSADYVNKKQWN